MAHFNHPVELSTKPAQHAIKKIRKSGAEIRTQSPMLRYINDSPKIMRDLWSLEVQLGCIPYYMFIVRDTGAQAYFGIPLVQAHRIFSEAYSAVSGLAKTVRGPIMSTNSGKVQILGLLKIGDENTIVLQFVQARNPSWIQKLFLAKYNIDALWLNELKPFNTEKFFFGRELRSNLARRN
jgi:L-lysine 2,3-aminomutase